MYTGVRYTKSVVPTARLVAIPETQKLFVQKNVLKKSNVGLLKPMDRRLANKVEVTPTCLLKAQ